MFGATREEKAYFGPYGVFLAGFLLMGVVEKVFEGRAAWPLSAPQYWVFPLQTVATGLALAWGWRIYGLRRPAQAAFGAGIAVVVFVLWLAPASLGAAPRLDGFDPYFFPGPAANGLSLAFRLVRLVIIVPMAEEIFWRGFLARYLVRTNFLSVPFGTFTQLSFWGTTVGFCLEHTLPDWPAALAAGALYNWVAHRTRSLSTCIGAHALTNALLGAYVLRTHQWGYW